MEHFALVVGQRILGEDLDVAEAGAVVQLDEAEAALGIAPGAHPTLQPHLAADGLHLAGLGDADLVHDEPPEVNHRGTENAEKDKSTTSLVLVFLCVFWASVVNSFRPPYFLWHSADEIFLATISPSCVFSPSGST